MTALVCGCSDSNPLNSHSFDTKHDVPPFNEIYVSHFKPAIVNAINEADQAIQLITSNRNEPTFENTIIPFDRRNEHLDRVCNIFFNLTEAEKTDSIVEAAEEIMPIISAANDDVYMNAELFARIKHVYDNRESANLDSTQRRVVELYYKDFVRSGATLDATKQKELREINQKLSLLSLTFGNNKIAETNNSYSLVIDTISDLAGLPDDIIQSAAEAAEKAGKKGKWLFTLHKASFIPFLMYADNAKLRNEIYTAYSKIANNGGEHDNKNVLLEIVKLRAKKAQILGYKTYAHYAIEENMAATPEAADSLLNLLWQPALKRAQAELSELKTFAYRYNRTTEITAADWWYWSEKLRKQKYGIDETTISEYFVRSNVRDAMFNVANKLYGITLRKADDIPVYDDNDCDVYEVFEANGDYLGLVYFDWFTRATKSSGAWHSVFGSVLENFDGSRTFDQSTIVYNFPHPTADHDALLSWDDVQTMFHEFGHGLHSLFTRGFYRRTAGNVPYDFVEMPSQLLEHWALEPEVIRTYARHYKTGEVMPDETITKLVESATFNQGFAMTELLAAAILDLRWHSLTTADNITNVEEFEQKAMDEIGLIKEILPRYKSTYFSHIFDGGYAAGYYVYVWSSLLDCDAFAAWKESGDIFNQEVSARFRNFCLAYGGEDDPMKQYIRFRGQKPDINYLLTFRGLNQKPRRPVYTQPTQQPQQIQPTGNQGPKAE